MKENLLKDLLAICSEIEESCAKIAGISGVMSDYWLVNLTDWARDDENEEEMHAWIKERYKIEEEGVGCFLRQRLMLVALYVYLNRKDETLR